jgi:hypothetical protein
LTGEADSFPKGSIRSNSAQDTNDLIEELGVEEAGAKLSPTGWQTPSTKRCAKKRAAETLMYEQANLKEKVMYYIAAGAVVVLVGVWAFFVLTEEKDQHGADFDQWTAWIYNRVSLCRVNGKSWITALFARPDKARCDPISAQKAAPVEH